MTYKMTDARRRVLAKFEGKEWHYPANDDGLCSCGRQCLENRITLSRHIRKMNPTYTTSADRDRIFSKMTPGDFHRFFLYFIKQSNQDLQVNSVNDHIDMAYILMKNPYQALCLAADWINERGL